MASTRTCVGTVFLSFPSAATTALQPLRSVEGIESLLFRNEFPPATTSYINATVLPSYQGEP